MQTSKLFEVHEKQPVQEKTEELTPTVTLALNDCTRSRLKFNVY